MQTKKRKLNEEPADRADDLVITKETYKGKELVRIEEDEAQERPFVREGIFRLIDLPAELRVYIYQFLMPYNMVITHDRSAFPHNKTCWCISAETKHKNDVQEADTPPRQIKYMLINLPHNNVGRISYTGPTYGSCNLGVACQLFLIDKTISNESLGALYGSNTYSFTVSGKSHWPSSYQSPLIFGPFGTSTKLPLLRNLRSIRINVLLDVHDHWAVKRQRARLDYFVSILKQHADDANKASLLHELQVNFVIGKDQHRHVHSHDPNDPLHHDKFMFGLESLVSLHGIKDVEITGVPDWYATCLQLAIRGKGGEVEETEWPLVRVKKSRTTWCKKSKMVWVSTRKWYQPVFNWKEFAERNGVQVPEDVEKYWVAVE